jgi:hypothetical protein
MKLNINNFILNYTDDELKYSKKYLNGQNV